MRIWLEGAAPVESGDKVLVKGFATEADEVFLLILRDFCIVASL